MDRSSEYKSVGIGGQFRKAVHAIVSEASVCAFLSAGATSNTSCDRLCSDPEYLTFNILDRKLFRYFVKSRSGASVFMGRAVHKQYFHVLILSLWMFLKRRNYIMLVFFR